MKALLTALLVVLFLPVPAFATYLGAYDYPFVNPLVATVVGTPPPYAAELPAIDKGRDVRLMKVQPFPSRRPPAVLWYDDALEYAVFKQHDGPAPLVFIIAGTGAGYAADKSIIMTRAMLKAGYNVVSLSNPTYSQFIVAASETGVPGDLVQDAQDLYRVIQLIIPEVEKRLQVTDIYLAGYSLGAAHAAFLAKLDDEEKKVGFKKVLMVNPPVSLYASMRRLDAMLDRYVANDPLAVGKFVDQTFRNVSRVYSTTERVELTGDFLYRAYLSIQPDNAELEQLIGLVFRLTANDLAFTSDVVNKLGYVVPPDARLTATSSLTPYLERGLALSFNDFFEGVYFPYYAKRSDHKLTRDQMVAHSSLASIQDYLRNSPKIGYIGTQDDVILGPGEIDFLESTFGARARIFPTGGHCGSVGQRDFVAEMIGFFQK